MSVAAPCPTTPAAHPLDVIRADRRVSGDAFRVASVFHSFTGQVSWLGWRELAERCAFHIDDEGKPIADGGKRRQSRAVQELVEAGWILNFRRSRFWRWFPLVPAELNLVAPRPKGRPNRFVVMTWRVDGPLPSAEAGDKDVPSDAPAGPLFEPACPHKSSQVRSPKKRHVRRPNRLA